MKTSNETTITKKELNSVFWRSFTINASFNYERQMNQGYVYSMIPVLKKLYPEKTLLADALKRHSEFFNVTPMVSPFVMGLSTAMEEQGAKDENFDKSSISAVKSALMGPLSGIGDSVFWGTLRPLAAGIACSLAMGGNVLAPIIFLLLFNIPNVLCRYYGLKVGYGMGTNFLMEMEKSGVMQKVFSAASMIGLMVIGGMVASMVSLNLGITIGSGDSAIALNDVVNGIMPKMLPLFVTFGLYKLVRKGIKPNTILLGIIIVSILGTLIGLF
ncbi:PTS system mannose/fructose/sorbose family transporter subunit IID [Candidatus Merdisoma sp. JLR.KK006]|uniref:PTS system mannose/fructose/sorbose family transporter subunit IID n=1 Tax=Candidatus Merdisoma sp. JLR.KK006 TaxID=3112626 RepID=UPI002FF1D261